jgi:hypothetical protein
LVLERGLLARSEVDAINDAFMRMHASGGVPGRYEPPRPEQDYDDGVHYVFEQGDPLARFPRVSVRLSTLHRIRVGFH